MLVVLVVGGLVISGTVVLVVWRVMRSRPRPQGFPVEPPARSR